MGNPTLPARWMACGRLLPTCALLAGAGSVCTFVGSTTRSDSLGASWHSLTVTNERDYSKWWTLGTAQLMHGSATHLANNTLSLVVAIALMPPQRVLTPAALLGVYFVSGLTGIVGSIAHTAYRFAPREEARLAASPREFNQLVQQNDAVFRIRHTNFAHARPHISAQQRTRELEQFGVPRKLRTPLLGLASQFPDESTHTLRRILVGCRGSVSAASAKLQQESKEQGAHQTDGEFREHVERMVKLYQPYKRWTYESTREVIGGSASVCGIFAVVFVQHSRLLVSQVFTTRSIPSLLICAGCAAIPISEAFASSHDFVESDDEKSYAFDHVAHLCGWVGGLVTCSLVV